MLKATWQAFCLMLWTKDQWKSVCRGSRPPSDLEARRERSLRPMRTRTRTLLARIERAEQAAKARQDAPPDCICFLENEQPEFSGGPRPRSPPQCFARFTDCVFTS